MDHDAGRDDADLPPLLGGRYRPLERLGRGGWAVVVRAEDVVLGRTVALKIVGDVEGDGRVLERLKREARAVARLRHENVVQTYAFGEHAGSYWIAMELVQGRDLGAIMRQHSAAGTTMEFERALDIVRQVARGLGAIHADGLLHLDVKPTNVVVEDGSDRAVLIDFGIARRRARPSNHGSFVGGTPSYMAPEQAACVAPEKMTPQTDLYALACTAFELFTGRPVFSVRSAYEMAIARAERPAPRLSAIKPELAPLDDVFARALAKSPEARHSDCSAFVSELEAAAELVREQLPCGVTSGVRLASGDTTLRALLVVEDAVLRDELTAVVASALHESGDPVAIECVHTAAEAAHVLERSPTEVVVIDAEAVGGNIDTVLDALARAPGGAEAEVLLLGTADKHPSELAVRELPRPPAANVLRRVIARIAWRAAERRGSRVSVACS